MLLPQEWTVQTAWRSGTGTGATPDTQTSEHETNRNDRGRDDSEAEQRDKGGKTGGRESRRETGEVRTREVQPQRIVGEAEFMRDKGEGVQNIKE